MTVPITCDGCEVAEEASTQYDSGVNEIDSVLNEGWVHNSSEDYCPACVSKGRAN